MHIMEQNQIPSAQTQESRNAILIGIVTAFIFGGLAFYTSVRDATSQLWSILPIFFGSLILIWLSSTGRHILGSGILIAVIAFQTILSPVIEGGLAVPNAVAAIALIGTIGFASLPREQTGRALLTGLLVAIAGV